MPTQTTTTPVVTGLSLEDLRPSYEIHLRAGMAPKTREVWRSREMLARYGASAATEPALDEAGRLAIGDR